jgi:predicted enzyme related to lactoylglutathione lyase
MNQESRPLAGGRFSHFFLMTRDHDVMVAFYRDTLGWQLHEHEAGAFAFLTLDGVEPRLALYPGRQSESAIENHWFLLIDVPDLARTVTTLAARGVDVGEIFDVPFGRAATFSDPEGNVIEVHQSTG